MSDVLAVVKCSSCGNEVASNALKCNCGYYFDKEAYEQSVAKREKFAREMEEEKDNSGFFAPEKKGIKAGVTGGAIMILIAVVWFFAGLAADRIFFYPPILFAIGIYALIKGLATGNIAGKKKE